MNYFEKFLRRAFKLTPNTVKITQNCNTTVHNDFFCRFLPQKASKLLFSSQYVNFKLKNLSFCKIDVTKQNWWKAFRFPNFGNRKFSAGNGKLMLTISETENFPQGTRNSETEIAFLVQKLMQTSGFLIYEYVITVFAED